MKLDQKTYVVLWSDAQRPALGTPDDDYQLTRVEHCVLSSSPEAPYWTVTEPPCNLLSDSLEALGRPQLLGWDMRLQALALAQLGWRYIRWAPIDIKDSCMLCCGSSWKKSTPTSARSAAWLAVELHQILF